MKATAPMDKVRQLQRKLYVSAKKSKTRRFHALYERIHDWGVLLESWKRVRAKGGAGGVDEETIKTIEAQGVEAFLRGIQTYLKEGRYHPERQCRPEIPAGRKVSVAAVGGVREQTQRPETTSLETEAPQLRMVPELGFIFVDGNYPISRGVDLVCMT